MYLDYYHLAQKPFQINTDPAFLWFGEKHKEALATLKYGLLENKSFLVLTGDIGVGKTTIINALLQEMHKKDKVAVITDPKLDNLDFFCYIAQAFGIPNKFTSKGRFLMAFWQFLLDKHYQGKKVLLIVDECQLLSNDLLEEIRLFSNLEKNGNKLINIFFVGQLEFNDILLRPENKALRQRITVNYNISPLSLKETEQYIEHRLAVAGTRQKIFDKNAIKEIYLFSNGYPRLINVIADRALLTGFLNSTRQVNKKIIQECAQELDISLINTSSQLDDNTNKNSTKGLFTQFRYLFYTIIVIALLALAYFFVDPSRLQSPITTTKNTAAEPPPQQQKLNKPIPLPAPPSPPAPAQSAAPSVAQPPAQIAVQPEPPPQAAVPVIPQEKVKQPAVSTPRETLPQPASTPTANPAELRKPENNANAAHSAKPADTTSGNISANPLIITFESDSLEMSVASLVQLEKLAEEGLRRNTAKIWVRGYTDTTGSTFYNKKLAEFRATSVKNILIGKGIAADRVDVTSPNSKGGDTASNQEPRRVEVEITNE